MKSFIKRNKLFTILILVSILTILFGIYHISIMKEETKESIKNNIIEYSKNINKNKNIIKTEIASNIANISAIWILGISIIGLFIIIPIYVLKTLLTTYEIIFIIIFYKETTFLFKIYFIIPKIIQTIILFISLLYSQTYSIILFRQIFQKKEYNLKLITKKYIHKFIVIIILIILVSLIETHIPKIIKIS